MRYAGDPVEYVATWDGAGYRWGFRGPGWYFWDETWCYCHGPYGSEEKARERLAEYALSLDKELK